MKLKDLGILPKKREEDFSTWNKEEEFTAHQNGFNKAIELCGEREIEIDMGKLNNILRTVDGSECWIGMVEDGRIAQAIAKALPTILRQDDK